MVTRYKIHTGHITNVFEQTASRHISGVDKEAVMETSKLGWYVTVDRMFSFYVGEERPALEIGQQISIVLEVGEEANA